MCQVPLISNIYVLLSSYLCIMNYFILFLFFLDKIEEAQKELNGAEVSKKGKLKSTPV